MRMNPPSLQVRIHGIDGSTQTFALGNPEFAKRALRELHPALLFSRDEITVAGDHSQSTLFLPLVARVDLITDRLSPFNFPSVLGFLSELTGAEFLARLRAAREQPVSNSEAPVLLSLELAGGQHTFLWAHLPAGMPAARMDTINRTLKERRLIFCRRRGGIGVLNLANLVRFSVHPKPPTAAGIPSPANSRFDRPKSSLTLSRARH